MVGPKIIFCLFLLLPLQFSLGSYGGSDLPFIRLVLPVIFLGWLAKSLLQKKIRLPKPLTLFTLSTFLFWAFLSVYWSENMWWALKKVVFWFTFFPLFLVLVDVFQKKENRNSALTGLVYGALFTALIGIGQFIGQFFLPPTQMVQISFQMLPFFLGPNFAATVQEYPSILVNLGGLTFIRAFAFFPDPHIFAFYTGMTLPLALFLSFEKERSFWFKLSPALLLMATLLSFSRSAYIALIVSGVCLITISFWNYRKKIPILIIFSGITLSFIFMISPLADRLASSFSSSDTSVTERTRLWQEAIINISQNPLLGVGLGNYPLHVKPDAVARAPIYVHNLYLDIGVELGLVGLILFLLFVASCIPKYRLLLEKKFSLHQAVFLALLFFLTQSLFEYPLFSVHILTLFITLLALLYVEKTQ